MRIKIPFTQDYLIRPKVWEFGVGTENEDLWNAGYRIGIKKILGIRFLYATKE